MNFQESKTPKETPLDSLLRVLRLRQVLPSIKQFNNPRLLDIGCGWEARLLKEVEPYIAQGVGIDFKAPEINTPKIRTISHYLESKDSMPQALNGGGGAITLPCKTRILQNI